jgi:hypothetical protein
MWESLTYLRYGSILHLSMSREFVKIPLPAQGTTAASLHEFRAHILPKNENILEKRCITAEI